MRHAAKLIACASALVNLWYPIFAADKPAQSKDDVFTFQLRREKVAPTRDGIKAFLMQLVPNPETEKKSQRLIAEMGHPKSDVRDAASRSLFRMIPFPEKELRAALRSNDLEIALRAQQLLMRVNLDSTRSVIMAALRTVERRRISGLFPQIAKMAEHWEHDLIFDAAIAAVRQTATPVDEQLAKKLLQRADLNMKVLAATALGQTPGKASPEIVKLMSSREPRLRIAAFDALADRGDRRCLRPLVQLLSAEQPEIRRQSAKLLRELTGQQFGYAPEAKAIRRTAAVAAWRNWVQTEGRSAKLNFPLKREPSKLNRTLVCLWDERTLVEYNSQNRVTFRAGGFNYVWGCWGTPEGHRIAVDSELRTVTEYDALGQICWSHSKLPGNPKSVQRLDNGNTLLALANDEAPLEAVVEIDLAGKIVWKLKITGRPTTAQRLPDGSTIINLQAAGRVVRVDREGNVETLLDRLYKPHTAEMLPNGNLLVVEMTANRASEFNPQGERVWYARGLNNPAQAQRLENGNTLVSDANGIHEYDPTGKVISELHVSRARFHRY